MNDLKYIIVILRGGTIDNARAIIFNGMLTHSSVLLGLKKNEQVEAHSAGFCTIEPRSFSFKIECFGESSSLGIKSNPDVDKRIIETTLTRMHYS